MKNSFSPDCCAAQQIFAFLFKAVVFVFRGLCAITVCVCVCVCVCLCVCVSVCLFVCAARGVVWQKQQVWSHTGPDLAGGGVLGPKLEV